MGEKGIVIKMKHNRLIIIGCGGHGRVAADVAGLMHDYSEICFLDDTVTSKENSKVIGKTDDYAGYIDSADFFVAVGNNSIRKTICEKISGGGAYLATLIHPTATVSCGASIGDGSIVMAGAVVNTGVKIGRGVILNTCCSVDHDSTVGNYSHIAVGAHIAGTVHVGEDVMIGVGAVVINNISICSNAVVGAGSTVIGDITGKGVYVGSPAKIKRRSDEI